MDPMAEPTFVIFQHGHALRFHVYTIDQRWSYPYSEKPFPVLFFLD